MGRLDEVITDLTSTRSNRRRLMKRAAALGLAVPALSLGTRGTLIGSAQDAKNNVIWVSPRGTLEVLDDYPYWVAKRFGYFGDIETELLPAIAEATSSSKAVADNNADMSYVSPGVFSLGVEAGIDLVSVFQMGAYDVFDIALEKGNPKGITSVKDLEGKTVVLGDLGWSGIVDPMVAQAGGDPSKVKYTSAGLAGWGQALQAGEADAALSWAGLRAQWLAGGLDFDYIIGKTWSKFPANSFQIRRSDSEDAALDDLYTRYLRGWAMGLEFGHNNPRAAVQITMEAEEISAALNATFTDKAIAVESMWQLADVYRGDWKTRDGGKWGWADMSGWTLFLDTIKEIGQLTDQDIAAEDIISNKYVAGANEFDKAQVKADADGFELSEEFAAVEVPAGAGTDDKYPD
jgi:NitT/TauT family transport system substrate-binding protein